MNCLLFKYTAGARYNIYQIKDKTKDSNRPMQMTEASLKVTQVQNSHLNTVHPDLDVNKYSY